MSKDAAFKATVELSALTKVLGYISRISAARNTIPILGNVLIEAGSGAIKFRATDLDMEVTDSCAATTTAGATTAPLRMLFDIARKLPIGSQVAIEFDGQHKLSVRAGRSRFTLSTLPTQDFPNLGENVEFTRTFNIAGADLARLIDRSEFAISTEETRYYLNGIYLHPATADAGGDVLRAVSTDGHRLARVDMPLPEGAAGMPAVIFPRKAVGEARKLFGDAESVEISLSQNKIRFEAGSIILSSKLIDGTYPDYSRVIPANNNRVAEVVAADLRGCVDRVSTVSHERGRAVKMEFKPGTVVLSVSNPDAGNSVEDVDISFDAEPIDIGFNVRYLDDILKAIQGSKVRIELADPGSPTIFRGEDAAALYVLMPMRV